MIGSLPLCQLKTMTSMADSSLIWNYTYDTSGMRTGRTNGTDTYTYVYNGGQLVSMKKNSDTLYFSYDASGVMSVTYNGTVYQYITNLQGDVVAIISPTTGEIVAEYTYDAWGNILSIGGSMEDSLAVINPLRYRGYVYDQETGLYYLQSRYYNPNMGRFINADGYISTGQGSFENNMFAYCLNNPVNMLDGTGFWPSSLVERFINLIHALVERALTVKYDVPLYDQGQYHLCWAYCQTMVEDFHRGVVKTPSEAFSRAKELAIQRHGEKDWDKGGWPTNCAGYTLSGTPISANGINTLGALYMQLVKGGPLYAYYHNGKKGDAASAHLVVVTGVNLYRGIVYTNNPHGISGQQTYNQFLNGFAGMSPNGTYTLNYYYLIKQGG